MEYYLRRNHPDKVIQLYDKFIASIEKKKSARGSEDRESSSDLIPPAMPSATTSPSPHSGEASTLLAVIAAHAIKDDFEAAMNIYTSTSIRTKSFSQNDERLTRLKYNPKLVQRLTVWIPRLHLASLVSRPQMLHKLLKRYANEQAVQPIEKLYQCLKDGLTGRAPFLTTKSQKPNTPNRLVLPAMIWTSFLSALMKCQRRDLAASLWDDMISFGIRPGLSMWTTLIDGFDNNRAVDEALAAWKMMRGQNVHPDGLAYRAIISALFNGNKSALAMRTFDEFQSTAMKTSPTDCTLSVYNTVLHGLLLTNQIDEANNLLQSMPQTGLKPDLISYNTLLAYHSRRGDLKELANVINDMSAANIIGDIFTFSTILSGMLKAGREDAPKLILKLMRKQGIEPNVATYSAIINHHMKRGDEISVRAAFLMLQQMEADPQIHPNDVTYTSVLANLYRNTWLSSEQVEEWRKDIVQRMERRGVKFNLPTYHILIKACLTNTESEGLKNALWYYHDMRKRKIPMANTTWYILLAGLLHREEWNIADEMVNQMYTTGLQPSGSLSELVGKIKKRTRILDPEV
ncbi:hypothetical protein AMATHDRAFT_72541 [Amanita thiersii Skay4041]|uniref:Pentacotripeptide-repeat region of PRORP domain-containing protein n=1 Tax=Amanita thiersii Skay4041 TaxID=703135 RepID=A0A2A9NYS2_9AGAR|nr:hypothetical protein AMATHDRAFT_72541 [Amanita thiersii Skay4041]